MVRRYVDILSFPTSHRWETAAADTILVSLSIGNLHSNFPINTQQKHLNILILK